MYKVDKEIQLMNFLLEKTNRKRNDIKNLLKYENIWVDGQVQTHYAYTLMPGQSVEIKKASKNKMELEILYEDKEIIVVNKPCGLLTEHTDRESTKTAYQIVKNYLSAKNEKIFLVHRLDQYTSGVLMFVKNKKLYDVLTHDWNKYAKVRGYIAVVEGIMNKPKGTIENYLAESKTQNVYITSKELGKKAITHYKVIKNNKKYTMVSVHLDTGRKNQIRVHMSSLHHPIAGDDKYGAKTNPMKRLGLHANEFVLLHPFTMEEMRFIARTPDVFETLFKTKQERIRKQVNNKKVINKY